MRTSDLFDIHDFEHKAIFEGDPEPWLILSKISDFLRTLPLGHIKGEVSPQAYLIQPELITIEKGAIVEPGAYIHGPCWIGKNSVVRHGAYIRGNLIAGEGCVIGHDTEVKNALFLNNAHAAHFAYVGDSILGNNINLGAGTICANLRLDRKEIAIQINGKKIQTGLRKFGAMIGDQTQIGCNSVLNPGTIIGKGVVCFPTINIGGYIPAASTVKPAQHAIIITP